MLGRDRLGAAGSISGWIWMSENQLCYRRSMPPLRRSGAAETIETFSSAVFVHRAHTITWTWHYLANTWIKAPTNYYNVELFSLSISQPPFKPSSFSPTLAFSPFVRSHRPRIETEGTGVKGIGCLSVVPILFFCLAIECCSFEKRETHHTDGDVDLQVGIFCYSLRGKKRTNEPELSSK